MHLLHFCLVQTADSISSFNRGGTVYCNCEPQSCLGRLCGNVRMQWGFQYMGFCLLCFDRWLLCLNMTQWDLKAWIFDVKLLVRKILGEKDAISETTEIYAQLNFGNLRSFHSLGGKLSFLAFFLCTIRLESEPKQALKCSQRNLFCC